MEREAFDKWMEDVYKILVDEELEKVVGCCWDWNLYFETGLTPEATVVLIKTDMAEEEDFFKSIQSMSPEELKTKYISVAVDFEA